MPLGSLVNTFTTHESTKSLSKATMFLQILPLSAYCLLEKTPSMECYSCTPTLGNNIWVIFFLCGVTNVYTLNRFFFLTHLLACDPVSHGTTRLQVPCQDSEADVKVSARLSPETVGAESASNQSGWYPQLDWVPLVRVHYEDTRGSLKAPHAFHGSC